MSEANNEHKHKLLRLISPKLYGYITNELQEKYNIHTYDLQIAAYSSEDGMELTIWYGGNFSHHQSAFFSHKQIDELSNEINTFIDETGKACTEVLIDDNFKLHAP